MVQPCYLLAQLIRKKKCIDTWGQGCRRCTAWLLSVFAVCFGDGGGAVMSPAFPGIPSPLRFSPAVDHNFTRHHLLQELLLNILRFDPGLLFLPYKSRQQLNTQHSDSQKQSHPCQCLSSLTWSCWVPVSSGPALHSCLHRCGWWYCFLVHTSAALQQNRPQLLSEHVCTCHSERSSERD